MAQKRISRFPLNKKFSGLSGHVPNYEIDDICLFPLEDIYGYYLQNQCIASPLHITCVVFRHVRPAGPRQPHEAGGQLTRLRG